MCIRDRYDGSRGNADIYPALFSGLCTGKGGCEPEAETAVIRENIKTAVPRRMRNGFNGFQSAAGRLYPGNAGRSRTVTALILPGT